MNVNKKLFRELAEIIGYVSNEINIINDDNEDLRLSDATQILATIEDKLVDVLYDSCKENEL